ncbi:hypothetical protein A2434_01170 [Candidatus Woesebacteria bacterium RIFOXYC1_FULL_41_14]|uniref:Phosphatase n=2 Tax=Candidatus Woeseibacteriota TaxID=1752722 RepID=A0A1F8CWJ3_9BACT|nr:MAG: HAD-superfamily hydrolase, subfamily IA, variant 3 [Candidatus Woesebacteria bacterium GW2011_GWD1_41_12]OGM80690.1 MAG: hypothetical protein A2393_01800 [Candidatus Woesebacteria bacterium RIFOXYB1_FULL_41_13]OGM84663.1 MAG: hypothetical protein A2434_01170 [Candidatus Woesebacteria bacterium RIFOXYC1_FULL_41_14]
MKISAVIFDLNGTVLEDEDEYGKAFNKVLKNLGVDSKAEYPHEKGIGVKENWNRLLKKYGIHTDKTPDILTKETQDAYLEEIDSVTIRSGFDDFIEKLKDSGLQIALATSNTWEQTDKILDTIDLQDVFDVVTTRDEVIHSKPDPDIFMVTADKLGVERYECLVLEDSSAGVEAAKRAGMKVIAISSDDDLEEISKADLTVENFSEVTPQVIDQL